MSDRATTLSELAKLVDGRIVGDGTLVVRGAATLANVVAGEITLVDKVEKIKRLASTQASAVVIAEGIELGASGPDTEQAVHPSAIVVGDVHAAFAKIVSHFRPPRLRQSIGVSLQAIVSPTARLGKGVNVHPGATIGDDCEIGDDTTILPGAHLLGGCKIGREVLIGPGAVLYENTVVGDRAIIQGGAVIGAFGFGYSQADGKHVLSAQLGNVRIENDVEVGACTTIDRGTYGATVIGAGTKIDNQVQIAHNCRIGRHNLICSQVGVAGSTTTGDYVVMGGQAGVRDHVHIGAGATLSAMAGITNDVADGAVMMGIPATPMREQKLKQAALAKLPEMRKEFKSMRAELAEIQRSHIAARDDNATDRAA